jgi:hypothetical protein
MQQSILEVCERERMGAKDALARRRAAIEGRLLNRGSGSSVRAI